MTELLMLRDVTKRYHTRHHGETIALKNVRLSVGNGESIGLVGESGSGKSTITRVALGLTQPDEGLVMIEGQDISKLSSTQLRSLRGRIGMVFQEPFQALDPRMSIQTIVEEPLVLHERSLTRAERRDRVAEALESVGLPTSFMTRRPAALSGGQQQRVGICRAIICRPGLLILDEPTGSLDASIQGEILALLRDLRARHGLAFLFVSHDLQIIEAMSDRIVVMRHGEVVENGPTDVVVRSPKSDYTRLLLDASIRFERAAAPPLA